MLSQLVRQDRGIEPIKAILPFFDHLDEGVENLGFLADLIAKAKVLTAFDKAQRF